MSDLLELANAANEAALAYREQAQKTETSLSPHSLNRARAAELVEAVDALASAVVEAENNRPTAADPFDPLIELFSRRREILAYADRRGIVFGQAVIELVNKALTHGLADAFGRHMAEMSAADDRGDKVAGDAAFMSAVSAKMAGAADDGSAVARRRTALPERKLVELRAYGRSRAGRFVDPAVIAECGRVLDERGELWAASVLGRDISRRSLAIPHRPSLQVGEEYVLVFADRAEDAHALGITS